MKYGILTIDYKNVNLGNRLIEYALRTLLNLPAPSVSVSMFSYPSEDQIAALNKCDFVLLPGSTILAKGSGQGEATACLSRIHVPKFCVGASYWSPNFPLNEGILKHITPPIGVRDPDTFNACSCVGADAMLVGCPTAYVPKIEIGTKPPYSIIGFARTNIDTQVNLLSKVPGMCFASIQEQNFELPIAKRLTPHVIQYDNSAAVYQCYAGAAAVYTGRLHSILPALSQHKPVFFFGDIADSRFSLLKMYGVTVNPITYNEPFVLTYSNVYTSALETTKATFYQWYEKTIKQFVGKQ